MPFGIEKIFSFGGKKEEKKEEVLKSLNDFKIRQEINAEPQKTIEKEIVKVENKEPQLHGFKIGDKVLLRDSLNNDIFKTKEVEIYGPAKNPNQVQIKMDNPAFGSKLVYDVYPNELIRLNEHEQRMAKQLSMQEVRFFKDTLVKIEKTEKRIAEVKSRHIFDKAMEDKILELRRVSQQLRDEVLKEKLEKERLESIRQGLWNVLGKIPDMLDNIEENYPSDDWNRVRVRRGYGK